MRFRGPQALTDNFDDYPVYQAFGRPTRYSERRAAIIETSLELQSTRAEREPDFAACGSEPDTHLRSMGTKSPRSAPDRGQRLQSHSESGRAVRCVRPYRMGRKVVGWFRTRQSRIRSQTREHRGCSSLEGSCRGFFPFRMDARQYASRVLSRLEIRVGLKRRQKRAKSRTTQITPNLGLNGSRTRHRSQPSYGAVPSTNRIERLKHLTAL